MNKETIVGVYNSGFSVPSVPWSMTICLWLKVMWSGEGEKHLEIAVLNPSNQEVGKTDGMGRATLQGYQSTLAFRGLLINADM